MKTYIYPSGKIVREYSWDEWRNREVDIKPSIGIIKSKKKSLPSYIYKGSVDNK